MSSKLIQFLKRVAAWPVTAVRWIEKGDEIHRQVEARKQEMAERHLRYRLPEIMR